MNVVFATSNPNKVRELAAALRPLGYDVTDLSGYPNLIEPIENGLTFADNARIKACSYAAQCGIACLAEDSGLEVAALGGRPGVHSARYSGAVGSREQIDEANNQKLLQELAATPWEQRGARFVAALCLARPDATVLAKAEAYFEGRIAFEPQGHNGFGYDPLFFVDEAGCTSAELSPEEKNRRSHRGQAARQLAQLLGTL